MMICLYDVNKDGTTKASRLVHMKWICFNLNIEYSEGGTISYHYHWVRVTHICVSKLTMIGSDNGLSPGRRQVVIWSNAGILLIETLETYFREILIKIYTFSFKKMHLKMSSGKWRSFCLCLNVLITSNLQLAVIAYHIEHHREAVVDSLPISYLDIFWDRQHRLFGDMLIYSLSRVAIYTASNTINQAPGNISPMDLCDQFEFHGTFMSPQFSSWSSDRNKCLPIPYKHSCRVMW